MPGTARRGSAKRFGSAPHRGKSLDLRQGRRDFAEERLAPIMTIPKALVTSVESILRPIFD